MTSHIPAFCENFLLDKYTNPGGEYFKRSAIMFAEQGEDSNTLNICGSLDRNCPAVQAIEFHRALLQSGAKSALVQYPQEGHWVQHHPAIADYGTRVVAWFEEHMPAATDRMNLDQSFGQRQMDKNDWAARRILSALQRQQLSRREALKALTSAGLATAAFRILGGDAWAEAVGPGGNSTRRGRTGPSNCHCTKIRSPVDSSLKPAAPSNIFNYAEYVDKKLLDAFAKKYDVAVSVTTFDSMDQAITKLSTKAVRDMDVTNVISSRVAQVVAGKLVQADQQRLHPESEEELLAPVPKPLLRRRGAIHRPPTPSIRPVSAGAATRSPKTSTRWTIRGRSSGSPRSTRDMCRCSTIRAKPWRWPCSIEGNMTSTRKIRKFIDSALNDLLALIEICNVKVNITGYQTLPEGSCWIGHNWSGNMLSGVFAFMPADGDPTTLQYWCPPSGKGPIQK